MKIKHKKGIQLNQAFGAVLTLVMIAVLVIVSIFLFAGLSTSTMAANTGLSVINESGFINWTNYTFACGSRSGAGALNIINATNASSTTVINSNNWTVDGFIIRNKTAQTWNWVNFTYGCTYTAATAASNASDSTISNFSNYPTLVGLVGTIIFLGIVIGVLVASFMFGGKNTA